MRRGLRRKKGSREPLPTDFQAPFLCSSLSIASMDVTERERAGGLGALVLRKVMEVKRGFYRV